ncbi:MAG: glucose dehydrogenase [Phycisphaerales bacterium]|nr:MAG: glucose dehydrogenase [Phycisphaerales bacterium]
MRLSLTCIGAMSAAFAFAAPDARAGSLATLSLEPLVTSGLSLPLYLIQDPVNDDTMYIVQQRGRVRTMQNGALTATDLIDLTGVVSTSGSERGLFSIAFDPDYANNGFVYASFTEQSAVHDSVIRRFTRSSANPPQLDPNSGVDILRVAQPFTNHNGGLIKFGPDGYLYVTLGDGGSGGDPGNRSQTPNNLLGKMLRIDPDRTAAGGYTVPSSNPFLPGNNPPIATAAPEIWSFGLRNPWRWSFDSVGLGATNAMLIADVGQNAREEVNYEPANTGARNYGWRRWEGTLLFSSTTPLAYEPHTPPIHEYNNPAVGRSITGGYVYRGPTMCSFNGRYIFADYQFRRVWSMDVTGGTASNVVEHTAELVASIPATSLPLVSSFGRDSKGEVYFVGYSPGSIYRIVSDDPPLQGDINGDGAVNFSDLSEVLSNFGTTYDFNDLSSVLSNFGAVCGA